MKKHIIFCLFVYSVFPLKAPDWAPDYYGDTKSILHHFPDLMPDAEIYYQRFLPLVSEHPLAHAGLKKLMIFFYTPGTSQSDDEPEVIEKRFQWLEKNLQDAPTDATKAKWFENVIQMHLKMDVFKTYKEKERF